MYCINLQQVVSTSSLQQYPFTIAFPIARNTIRVYKPEDHIPSPCEDTQFALTTLFFAWDCLKVGWGACSKTELCYSTAFQVFPKLHGPAHPDRYCSRSTAVGTSVAAPVWCPPGSASAGCRWEDALRLQVGAFQAACSPQDTLGEFLLWSIWSWVRTSEMNQCGQLLRVLQASCSQSFMTMTIMSKASFLAVFPLIVRTGHK